MRAPTSWGPEYVPPYNAATPYERGTRPVRPRRRCVARTTTSPGDAWRVVAADYVTTEDGTGIVHTAPAFGMDDFATGQKRTACRPSIPIEPDGTLRAKAFRSSAGCGSRTPTGPSSATCAERGRALPRGQLRPQLPARLAQGHAADAVPGRELVYHARPRSRTASSRSTRPGQLAAGGHRHGPVRSSGWRGNVDWAHQPDALLGHAAAHLGGGSATAIPRPRRGRRLHRASSARPRWAARSRRIRRVNPETWRTIDLHRPYVDEHHLARRPGRHHAPRA